LLASLLKSRENLEDYDKFIEKIEAEIGNWDF
jgi:hypothetical protein